MSHHQVTRAAKTKLHIHLRQRGQPTHTPSAQEEHSRIHAGEIKSTKGIRSHRPDTNEVNLDARHDRARFVSHHAVHGAKAIRSGHVFGAMGHECDDREVLARLDANRLSRCREIVARGTEADSVIARQSAEPEATISVCGNGKRRPQTHRSRAALEPVFAAVRSANRGTLSTAALEAAFRDCWIDAFDVVAQRHGCSDAMLAAGCAALLNVEVRERMHGYGDLHLLPDLGEKRYLVTSGFRRLQESKVRALGIAPQFDAIVIDAIGEPERIGKQRIFEELMMHFALDPNEVLVVGDNPRSELAAAGRLGLQSVQTLRPGVAAAQEVTARVGGLAELRTLLDSMP